jgi:uncharacterized membrane protein
METVELLAELWVGMAAEMGIADLAFWARVLDISGALAAAVLGMFGWIGIGGSPADLFYLCQCTLKALSQKAKSSIGQNFANGSRSDAG